MASVRENRAGGPASSNFPLGPGPEFSGEVGLLTARNVPLLQLLVFAYAKNMYQIQGMRAQLPDWARQMRFDVQARADGNPTKDQMRAMMRSLLEDRFGLKVHTEMREVPVFGLVLVKPGKLGERLRVHTADEAACSQEPPSYYRGSSAVVATVAGRISGILRRGGVDACVRCWRSAGGCARCDDGAGGGCGGRGRERGAARAGQNRG